MEAEGTEEGDGHVLVFIDEGELAAQKTKNCKILQLQSSKLQKTK